MDDEEGSPDGMNNKDPFKIQASSTGVDRDIPTPEQGDKFVGVSIMLPRGEISACGKVIARKRDAEGNPAGRADTNPVKDSCTYEAQFPASEVAELTANVIVELMYALCDQEGNAYLLFDCIVGHKKSNKALMADTQTLTHNGRKSMRRTTAGWHLCVQRLDGSTS